MNTDQLKTLAQSIAADFLAGVKGAGTLSADEQATVSRATQALAEAAVYAIGADPATQAALKVKADLAAATLANIGVAHAIDAEAAVRKAVYDGITKAIGFALSVAVAAV